MGASDGTRGPGAPLRVGVIGHGAIGSVLAAELTSGRAPHATLSGVVATRAPDALRVDDVATLAARSDLVVEAAGQDAVRAHAATVLDAGVDLLVASVGAFADDALLAALTARAHPHAPVGGRLLVSTGATGGVDLLRAAALSGGLASVRIVTTKPAAALIAGDTRPAPAPVLDAVARGEAATLFVGTAREAAVRFPSSTNSAVTVALATIGMDAVEVEVVADPSATVVTHRIEASGDLGRHTFHLENRPSVNPRTSAITAYALLRAIVDEGAVLRIV